MPNVGKAKTVDEIYQEYLLHQVSTGEIERSTYSNTFASVKLKDTFNDKVIVAKHSDNEYMLACPCCKTKDWCIEQPTK